VLAVGIPHQHGDPTAALAALGNPRWYNWISDHVADPLYTPMAWWLKRDTASQRRAYDTHIARANADPQRLWLLLNEPNFAGQADTTPDAAAAAVRMWTQAAANPFAVAGVALPNEQSLQWLSDYLAAGGPVGDYWHIHIYTGTPERWAQTYSQFEGWMLRNGVERPVIVSETSAGSRGLEAQRSILEYLPYALRDFGSLHAVYWYSARDFQPAFANGDLLTEANELTELGQVFAGVQAAGIPERDHRLYMPAVERGR
jgi:hypothetical protein